MVIATLVLAAILSADERQKMVVEIGNIVESSYAVPEVGSRMAVRLRQRLKAGAYNGLSLSELAERVDRDLRSIANDQHMMLMYSPEKLAPDLGQNATITNPSADPSEAQYRNDGIIKVERLAGNVGYVEIERFFPPDQALDTIAAAMSTINSTDALIVDVRSNIGGHPGTVAFFCSYFFERRIHLNDIYDRRANRTTTFWTDPNVPGKRYLEKPVFVLVSGESFSAAEEFAYNMKVLGRAKLIGATTAGAANPAIPLRLSDHLVFYIPIGRAVNPVTRTNWEGVGVEPDVEVDPTEALRRAHAMALETLIAKAPNHRRNRERRSALDQLSK